MLAIQLLEAIMTFKFKGSKLYLFFSGLLFLELPEIETDRSIKTS